MDNIFVEAWKEHKGLIIAVVVLSLLTDAIMKWLKIEENTKNFFIFYVGLPVVYITLYIIILKMIKKGKQKNT